MATEVNEPITVGAVFSRGTVKPVWFSWHGRQIRVREIAFSWNTREGRATALHFSVTDGQGLYEITYNTLSCAWVLMNSE